jgi:L-rhamnose isomerase
MQDRDLSLKRSYYLACERYEDIGVDVEAALGRLATISVSLHCWQGDDVGGFEGGGEALGGGLAVTGNHPGKARTPGELRSDLEKAYALIPGRHRLNLHASYAETGGETVDRDEIRPEHFLGWIEWAKRHQLGIDFNPTFFSHPRAADGFTLSHQDEGIRRFWIDHGIACRRVGAAIGQTAKGLGSGWPGRSTRASPSRSTRATIATRSRPSCSAWVRSLMWLARTSSTSATP